MQLFFSEFPQYEIVTYIYIISIYDIIYNILFLFCYIYIYVLLIFTYMLSNDKEVYSVKQQPISSSGVVERFLELLALHFSLGRSK